MVSLRHLFGRFLRVLSGTFAAVALLATVTACASTNASPGMTSEHFLPGWQAHAKPLFNQGMARDMSRDRWYVPGNLPPGLYVVVDRDGDKARVIEGHSFEIKPAGMADIYVYLDPGHHDVQALPIADVPEAQKRMGLRAAR